MDLETEAEHCLMGRLISGDTCSMKRCVLLSFQAALLAPTSQSDNSEVLMNLDQSTGQEMSGYSPESSLSPPPPLQRVMDPGMFSFMLFPTYSLSKERGHLNKPKSSK